jgi:hypothetical protein
MHTAALPGTVSSSSRSSTNLIQNSEQKKKMKRLISARLPCLVKDCPGMIVSFFPFCKGCYLQCTSGKMSSMVLRDNLGTASYDTGTQKVIFPPSVPTSRIPVPGKKGKEKRKELVSFHRSSSVQRDDSNASVLSRFVVAHNHTPVLHSNGEFSSFTIRPGLWYPP